MPARSNLDFITSLLPNPLIFLPKRYTELSAQAYKTAIQLQLRLSTLGAFTDHPAVVLRSFLDRPEFAQRFLRAQSRLSHPGP